MYAYRKIFILKNWLILLWGLARLILISQFQWWKIPWVFVYVVRYYLSFIFEGQFHCVQYSWLAFFSFSSLNVSSHSFLVCSISFEKSANSLMRILVNVMNHFSLALFRIFSLSLIFDNLIIMCLAQTSSGSPYLKTFRLCESGCSLPSGDLGSFQSLFL